ncbi:lysozyme g-like [Protopterus annectens]|uniref:lysozyme g-like n=1 Tax=Protopterus annectens TaxID=7888 RepID=UPI001CFA2CFA|nr:lysozyme g-like [Protopterus annectens]
MLALILICLAASNGVQASHKMAEPDMDEVNKYKPKIKKVTENLSMGPSVLAGMISRDSQGVKQLDDGWNKDKSGYGLMQAGKQNDLVEPRDSEDHLDKATKVLTGRIHEIKKKFPSWTAKQQLNGAVVNYHMGTNNVSRFNYINADSPRDDYAADVIARARYYKRKRY